MSTPENGDSRISMSEYKLRIMLADFKLELVQELQKYATAAMVAALDLRVNALELDRAKQAGAQQNQQLISGRMVAWAAVVVGAVSSFWWVPALMHR